MVGSANRLDLLYYYDDPQYSLIEARDPDYFIRNFIIVELKFRQLRLEDLTQLSRYMNAIYSCDTKPPGVFENEAIGVLVGNGLNYGLELVNGSGILDRQKMAIIDISAKYDFSRLEQEIVSTNVNSIDKSLKKVLEEEPSGYIPLEELDKIRREMKERSDQDECHRVSETS